MLLSARCPDACRCALRRQVHQDDPRIWSRRILYSLRLPAGTSSVFGEAELTLKLFSRGMAACVDSRTSTEARNFGEHAVLLRSALC